MSGYEPRRPVRPWLQYTGLILSALTAIACASPEPGAEPNHPTIPQQDAAVEPQDEHHEEFVELTPEAVSQVEIRTVPAEKRILATELNTTGQVDFDQTRLAHVSPRISGRVHRVDAILGEPVDAGQKMAEIDSIELGRTKAVFLQSKAKEELARTSFNRAQSLFTDRIASEQVVLEAEAVLREATAGLHTAEETLHLYGLSQEQVDGLTYDDREASIYPLRAPFAGTVVDRHATLGELVTPDRNLFTLADLSQVWIWIDVYQRDLGGVHIGDQARARVDAFPDQVFAGTISYISARVDTDTRTIRARLDVANPEGKLRPGMFVAVGLIDPHAQNGEQARGESLVVPEGAVVRDGDERFVFITAGEHRFARREVRVGRKAGGFVEIKDGIAKGDRVVVEGVFLLKSALAKESLGGGHSH
jgi:cobalt-zinc-cadmium efflux system membrane fusion protein